MRALLWLVVLTIAAAACADSSPPLAETSTDRVQLDVMVSPDPLVSGQRATFELQATNVSDRRALLTFDTTQRGDVALSTDDVEVYRWAERRAFAGEETEVPLTPGQQTTFPLEVATLPVAPGEYELLALVTGLPKLQTFQSTVSVVGPEAVAETPSPSQATPVPALPAAYGRLSSAAETTVRELALPLASGLAESTTFDAEGAVVRHHLADGFARLSYAELLLASQVLADDGDVEGARALAEDAATRLNETFGRLRSVETSDQETVTDLLREHVAVAEEYARVVADGGGEALDVPRSQFEELAADLGALVAVTAGRAIDSDAAGELFSGWSEALGGAIQAAPEPAEAIKQVHTAATEAVEPLALTVAQAYVEHLDLDGYETTAAVLRQELTSQLVDEVFLVATAADVRGLVQRDAVVTVLDENADELAEAVGQAPSIDASEESAFLERWRTRAVALLDAVASPEGDASAGSLEEAEQELAALLADASPALDTEEVRGWLRAQREALLEALRALTD